MGQYGGWAAACRPGIFLILVFRRAHLTNPELWIIGRPETDTGKWK